MIGKTLLFAGLGLALAGCNSTSGNGHVARSGDLDTTGMITLEQAVAAASAAVPGGWAIEAELEIEDEGEPPAYEVVFHIPGAAYVTDVEVDAYTGEILEIENDTEVDDEDEDEADDNDDDEAP